MSDFVLQSARVSLLKHDEFLCGDYAINDLHRQGILILSDGMGSGVKANILASLTAHILHTMLAEKRPLAECVETIASTLPVCHERQMAYSTFTALQITKDDFVHLVQYDNPFALLMRQGKRVEYPCDKEEICGKEIYKSTFSLQKDDRIILMTDGVTNAGLGKTMPDGFSLSDVADFIEKWYTDDMSPKRLATLLATTCRDLCLGSPDDDISVLVVRAQPCVFLNLMIGPPEHKEDDDEVMQHFFDQPGLHVVCGGTTAHAAARFLKKKIVSAPQVDPAIPAISYLTGVDLVTEGVITLQRVLKIGHLFASNEPLLWDLPSQKDGASLLSKLLFEKATHIAIYVGQAVNPAHQSQSSLGIDYEAKMELIEKLHDQLQLCEKHVEVKMV